MSEMLEKLAEEMRIGEEWESVRLKLERVQEEVSRLLQDMWEGFYDEGLVAYQFGEILYWGWVNPYTIEIYYDERYNDYYSSTRTTHIPLLYFKDKEEWLRLKELEVEKSLSEAYTSERQRQQEEIKAYKRLAEKYGDINDYL